MPCFFCMKTPILTKSDEVVSTAKPLLSQGFPAEKCFWRSFYIASVFGSRGPYRSPDKKRLWQPFYPVLSAATGFFTNQPTPENHPQTTFLSAERKTGLFPFTIVKTLSPLGILALFVHISQLWSTLDQPWLKESQATPIARWVRVSRISVQQTVNRFKTVRPTPQTNSWAGRHGTLHQAWLGPKIKSPWQRAWWPVCY